MQSVTAKEINPYSRSDYINYLIRDVHCNDVLSLNGVKTLLKSWERGSLQSLILMWDFIGAIRMHSDIDVKEFLSILKEKPECVLWCMERSTKKRSRDNRSSSEASDVCHEVVFSLFSHWVLIPCGSLLAAPSSTLHKSFRLSIPISNPSPLCGTTVPRYGLS